MCACLKLWEPLSCCCVLNSFVYLACNNVLCRVVAHTSASLKSSLAYSFLRNRIVGSALPASGYKLAATTEVAGLGGDVQHLRATSSVQAAMSFGRYMPDTGYQMPLSKATYLAQWNGTLPPEDTKALAAQRASLHPNPQSNSLLDVDIIRPPRRDAMSDFTTSASESGLPPTDRAELFLRTEKGVAVAHSAFEPEFPVAARLQGWLSSGVTLLADARVGGIWSFGGDRGVAGGSRLCDRFFMTGLSMRGFESVGPKAAPKPGGTPYGDALGGNLVATATLRCLLPPPLPSVRLTNAGMRTQVFGTVGTLGGLGASTLQLENVSAAVGVGLVSCRVLFTHALLLACLFVAQMMLLCPPFVWHVTCASTLPTLTVCVCVCR